MSEKYIIACDLGSQSVKTAIYNTRGQSLNMISKDTKIYTFGPNALVYQGDDFYHLTTENIQISSKTLKINPKDVAAISFTGMGGGIIGVDENWNPTSEYTNPLDSRDQPYFSQMMKNHSELIRLKSGTGSPMGANKILWFKNERPDIYKKSKKFMMVTQYVQGKLVGAKANNAFWENSSPALSGLADTVNNNWSDEIFKALKIDIEKLPKIVNTTCIVGTLTKKAADDCGLVEGIPVIAGAWDKTCDFLGSGANVIGSIVDNSATYPGIMACVDKYIPDIKYNTLECNPSAIDGLWLISTYIIGGGLTHKWFIDTFCKEESEEAKRAGVSTYEILDKKASQVPPGSEGLLFVPHLNGRATPSDTDVRGLCIGFTWTHSKEHFYRAILESIAFDHANALNIAKAIYPHIDFNKIIVLGGGASSNYWNQIKSDITGISYYRLNRKDTATLGAAIIGGKAVGIFEDMQKAAQEFTKTTDAIQPVNKQHKYYQNYVKEYDLLFHDLKEMYRRLTELRKLPHP